jgi:integrase
MGIFERPIKSGVWWISYKDSTGRRHREKVGRRDKANLMYAERRREIGEGRYVPPRSAGRTLTFRALASAAMAHKKLRLRPLSYFADQWRLGKVLGISIGGRTLGAMPAEAVTQGSIDAVLDQLLGMGLCGGTVNRYRSLLSSIFGYGVRDGILRANPVARVKRLKENPNRVRYLRADEEERLRAEIRSSCPEREPEMDLALYTGMRRGEQFTLKWDDVDLETGNLRVRGKTGERYVKIGSKAKDALEKLRAASRARPSAYVCPDAKDGRAIDWRRWFENAVKRAGVHNFHWHDLRHTFASRLVIDGVDIVAVKELLGHKSILMTMRYSHLSETHLRAAAEKIGRPT